MKPDDKHAEYTEFSSVWKTCRDASKGQRAIHKGGELYLPKLDGQSNADYLKYKLRALYYNGTGRTVEAMKGLIFRKKPVLVVPKAMLEWLEDITMTGISFIGLAKKNMEEVIEVGRYGLLVDYPHAPGTIEGAEITINDAALLDIRPYISPYTTECILNWRNARVGSKTVLIDVFLYEAIENDTNNKFQIRQLTLEKGFYEQVVWRKGGKGWSSTRVTPLRTAQH